MASQRILDMIIRGKNEAKGPLDEAKKGLGDVGSAAEEAGGALKGAGDEATEAGGKIQGTGKHSDQTSGILAKMGKVVKVVAGGLGDGAKQADGFGSATGKAGKGGVNTLLHNLSNLVNVAGAVKGAIGSVAGAIGESLARSAERGDAGALKLLGAMGKMKQSMDKVVATVVQDLLPAIMPLVKVLADLAIATARWLKENKVVETVIQVVIGATIGLLRALDKASVGFQTLAEIARVVFAKAMGAVQGAIASTLEVLARMIREAAVFSQVLDQEVADSLLRTMQRLDRTAAAWKASAEEASSAKVGFIETSGAMGAMADSLEGVSDQIAKASASSRDASLEMLAYSEQGMARLAAMMEVELAEVGENQARRLAIFQKYYDLEAQAGRANGQRALELKKEIQTSITEMEKGELEARFAQQIELNQGNALAIVEIWEKHLEQLKVKYEENSPQVIEAETGLALAREELQEESAERIKSIIEESLEWYNTKTQEQIEKELSNLDVRRELGASEEEIIEAKIALFQKLAENESLTAEQRMNAEKAVTQLKQQQAILQIQAAQQAAQQTVSLFQNMAGILFSTGMSTKEKLSKVFQSITENIVNELSKQVQASITSRAQQAAATAAAAQAEAAASGAAVVPKTLAAHSHIPIVGPALAAVAIAAFQALASRVFKFNSGGWTPSYEGGGSVPGTGFTDSFGAELTAQEFVMRSESARRIGPAALNYMNETGEIPQSSEGGGVRKVQIELKIAGGDDELIDVLARKLSAAVTGRDVQLVSSHLNVAVPA